MCAVRSGLMRPLKVLPGTPAAAAGHCLADCVLNEPVMRLNRKARNLGERLAQGAKEGVHADHNREHQDHSPGLSAARPVYPVVRAGERRPRGVQRGPACESGEWIGGTVDSIVRLQEHIAMVMECGDSLEQVEQEVIAGADIGDEQRAALWLYAWSFMNGTAQRHEASSHLLSTRGL